MELPFQNLLTLGLIKYGAGMTIKGTARLKFMKMGQQVHKFLNRDT
jgi:predicted transcriptional regulator